MGKRFPFPGLPTGWYVVALSQELEPGAILTKRYFDREIVIYRTEAGEARVIDAFCPHMGAHLGRVGAIEGDQLKCRFHGFKYGGDGRCSATPYGGPPPPRARLKFWEVREHSGLILVWFHSEDAAPDWEVPALADADDWARIRFKRYQIPTHPQETTENSVDFGHFTQIHGFHDGTILEPVQVDGELLTTRYRAFRGIPSPKLAMARMSVDYSVIVRGLGYSQVNVRIEPFKIDFRVWVLPIPVDEENIELVIGGTVPRRYGPLIPPIRAIAHNILCTEVDQDLDVWTYKTYVENPALAKGDGPVATYRRYVRQFYPDYVRADAERNAPPISPAPSSTAA